MNASQSSTNTSFSSWWKKWCNFIISSFIVFNIFTILISSTRPLNQQSSIEKFFFPYALWTRLLQTWPLFSPAPKTYTQYYRVEITFKDGTTQFWRRPQPPNWDFFERHLAYNFQKYDSVVNNLDNNPALREDLSLYIKKLFWSETNPPERIKILRMMADIPPPHEEGYVMHDPSELKWREQLVSVYSVPENRLW